MAELPRMVIPLKGSRRFRTASRAFSFGVSALTCGPLRKRAYQLTKGANGGQASGLREALMTGLAGSEAIAPAAPAWTIAVASLLIWQGAALLILRLGGGGWCSQRLARTE